MDSPLKLMQTTRGDMRQIEVVSDLYASELTDIVNIESLKLDFLTLDMEDILNTTNQKVYTKAQILSFVDSAQDLFKSQRQGEKNLSASVINEKKFVDNLQQMTLQLPEVTRMENPNEGTTIEQKYESKGSLLRKKVFSPDKKQFKNVIKKVFSQIIQEIEMEKSAVNGSFISSGTMQNVLNSDMKIEKVSRNQKVSNTSEKIISVYDQIQIENQVKAVEVVSDGDNSQSGQLSDRALAYVNQEIDYT